MGVFIISFNYVYRREPKRGGGEWLRQKCKWIRLCPAPEVKELVLVTGASATIEGSERSTNLVGSITLNWSSYAQLGMLLAVEGFQPRDQSVPGHPFPSKNPRRAFHPLPGQRDQKRSDPGSPLLKSIHVWSKEIQKESRCIEMSFIALPTILSIV